MPYALFLFIWLFLPNPIFKAQIPIEIMVGDAKVSQDSFFFKDLTTFKLCFST
nr:hypothetical protein [uncultured bacterium]